MKALLKPIGFSIFLTLVFTSVTYILPQAKGEAPGDSEVIAGTLSIDSLISMGEKLYAGKGTCTLCHNKLGRAPDLLSYDVAKVSVERIADSRYQGKAMDAEGYLRESMLQPGAYVVKGFGKKGSNDTESPMPAIDQAPTELSEVEISAVIAYLQHKDGNPVTVALPKDAAAPPAELKDPAEAAKPAVAQTAEEAIAKFGCAACHSVLKTESSIGPSLNDVGKRLKTAQIRNSIVDPKAEIAKGYPPIMPDFPTMTIAELELLVRFLAKQNGARS
ncbi:MAG: c-type cytochrome [Burkholderiaceae bacterium]